jgi:NAD(P)H-flavin reductase
MEQSQTNHIYTARVVKKFALSSKVFLFTFTKPVENQFSFSAGQFINIDVGNNIKRQYSIASSPLGNGTFDLLIDIAPGGPGSKYFEQISEQDSITFSGPMGKFTIASETGELIFLAAGTGIAPFKSMITYLLTKTETSPQEQKPQLYLLLGFRYEQDMFLVDYFQNLQNTYPNFHYTLTLSQPPEGWQGNSGYVQSYIPAELFEKSTSHFYVCGGNNMVQGTLAYLREKNIPDERIHFEPF